jgi:hypothetical protein
MTMQPQQRPQRTVTRNLGEAVVVVLACVMLLAACDAPQRLAGVPQSALAVSASPQAARLEAFNAVQATYCNDAVGLDCAGNAFYDLGFISAMCTRDCATSMTVDIGGANRRWWTRRGLPEFAPFSNTGTIVETRTADGRRRLVLSLRAQNTFIAFSNSAFQTIVGADFFEYPTIAEMPETPAIGTVAMQAEMILPQGFSGMPDIAQAVFDPGSGIELLRMDVTAEVDGPLRIAFEGLAAGTLVRVSGTQRWQNRLALQAVPSRRLIQLDYDATSRISVRALR